MFDGRLSWGVELWEMKLSCLFFHSLSYWQLLNTVCILTWVPLRGSPCRSARALVAAVFSVSVHVSPLSPSVSFPFSFYLNPDLTFPLALYWLPLWSRSLSFMPAAVWGKWMERAALDWTDSHKSVTCTQD